MLYCILLYGHGPSLPENLLSSAVMMDNIDETNNNPISIPSVTTVIHNWTRRFWSSSKPPPFLYRFTSVSGTHLRIWLHNLSNILNCCSGDFIYYNCFLLINTMQIFYITLLHIMLHISKEIWKQNGLKTGWTIFIFYLLLSSTSSTLQWSRWGGGH